MLSEGTKLTERKRLRNLPELEPPVTVRLKFRKVGSLRYISHLDLQRTFNRVIVRACIPVWYTKGFNPHAKLVFSTPLSVGAESEYEFLDIRIDREMACEEIMERLNRELTEELCITEAYLPKADFSEIAWSSYRIEIHTANASESLAGDVEKLFGQSPLMMTKKTKSGEKEVDIVPLIHELRAEYDSDSGNLCLQAILRTTSGEFLNPELLITAMKQKYGILSRDPLKEYYSILRTCSMKEDFTPFL